MFTNVGKSPQGLKRTYTTLYKLHRSWCHRAYTPYSVPQAFIAGTTLDSRPDAVLAMAVSIQMRDKRCSHLPVVDGKCSPRIVVVLDSDVVDAIMTV